MELKRCQAKPEFVSRPEVLSVLSDVSGDDINGLGESAQRRAMPVMWHDPDIIAHGRLQSWYRNQSSAPPARHYLLQNKALTEKALSDIAPVRPDWSAEEATKRVKQTVLAREADKVGIARMNQDCAVCLPICSPRR